VSAPVAANSAKPRIDSMTFKDVEVTELLSIISTQFNVPIAVNGDVSGRLASINLKDITAEEALTTVTRTAGLSCEKVGSTYIISGPEHRLWFIEPGGDMIGSITTAGVIRDCALSETGGSPSSLALGVGDSLWITQSDADAIVEMTPDGLLHPYQLAAHTHPGCITRGADGAMWFIAGGLGTIGRIAGDGTVRYFPLQGISGVPDGLVAGPDGRLWFPEYQTNRIGQLSMHGQVSEVIGSRTIGDGTMGMIGDPRSRAFWFTSGSQIFRVAENGTTTAFQSSEGDQEFADITTGADGKLLWWADDRTGAVGWINQDGAISGFALPHANVQPSSIIAGPDGNMWFSESHGSAIGRVTPDGTITEFGGN